MTLPLAFKYSSTESPQKNSSKTEYIDETYECSICGKYFYRKASLTIHVNSHNLNNNLEEKIDRGTQNTCHTCLKKFTAKKNLLKHLRYVHKNYSEAERMVVKKIKCPEKNCGFLCRMMKELRDHIEKSHKIKILKDTLQFPNETVFQKWKKEEESNTVSWFVTGRKKTTLMDGTKKQILYCHRTGHYSPKGFGKYRMRSVGSCKIGVTCPAAMEVIESPDGELTVIYYKTHLGHMQDVVHLKLSREERAHLAEKIKQGFSLDAILEGVKESQEFTSEKKKRIHLLSKKDLYSIMRTENCSTRKSIKEMQEKNTSEFVFKKKGDAIKDNNVNVEKVSFEKTEENIYQSFTLFPSCNVVSHEKERDFKKKPHLPFGQKCQKNENVSQKSTEEIGSQIVVLSQDITSVAEVILLSGGEDSPAQPAILPKTKVPILKNFSPQEVESQTIMELDSDTIIEERKKNKSCLHLQLKEKIQKISELLPQSDYLTPKQFDLINTKLKGILDIFNVANIKANARKQNFKKKFLKKDKNLRNENIFEKIEYKTERNLVPHILDSPLVYAVYN